MIVDGELAAAAVRRPPTAVGDGTKTVREHIDSLNDSPLRGEGHQSPLTLINIDEVADFIGEGRLEEVLSEGESLELLGTANLSRGGGAENITDKVAPEIIDIALKVASATGLGICGVDVMTEDISDGSAPFFVIEVNVSPGIRMHHFPAIGEPVNAAQKILNAVVKNSS